jgi:LysM repeat protein
MGTSELVSAQLADAPEVLASFKMYTVKRGETLPLIARKLHVSRNDLADANYLSATARVNAGQQLMVPYEATALMAAQSDRPVPATEARRTVPPTGTLAETSSASRVKVIYQVKQGDTLASIARVFKTSVATIRTWNPASTRIACWQDSALPSIDRLRRICPSAGSTTLQKLPAARTALPHLPESTRGRRPSRILQTSGPCWPV